MGCQPLVDDSGNVIGVMCFAEGWNQATGHSRVAWCFNCRTYALHWLYLFVDSSGWYEAEPSWKCVYCGKDATRFPGM